MTNFLNQHILEPSVYSIATLVTVPAGDVAHHRDKIRKANMGSVDGGIAHIAETSTQYTDASNNDNDDDGSLSALLLVTVRGTVFTVYLFEVSPQSTESLLQEGLSLGKDETRASSPSLSYIFEDNIGICPVAMCASYRSSITILTDDDEVAIITPHCLFERILIRFKSRLLVGVGSCESSTVDTTLMTPPKRSFQPQIRSSFMCDLLHEQYLPQSVTTNSNNTNTNTSHTHGDYTSGDLGNTAITSVTSIGGTSVVIHVFEGYIHTVNVALILATQNTMPFDAAVQYHHITRYVLTDLILLPGAQCDLNFQKWVYELQERYNKRRYSINNDNNKLDISSISNINSHCSNYKDRYGVLYSSNTISNNHNTLSTPTIANSKINFPYTGPNLITSTSREYNDSLRSEDIASNCDVLEGSCNSSTQVPPSGKVHTTCPLPPLDDTPAFYLPIFRNNSSRLSSILWSGEGDDDSPSSGKLTQLKIYNLLKPRIPVTPPKANMYPGNRNRSSSDEYEGVDMPPYGTPSIADQYATLRTTTAGSTMSVAKTFTVTGNIIAATCSPDGRDTVVVTPREVMCISSSVHLSTGLGGRKVSSPSYSSPAPIPHRYMHSVRDVVDIIWGGEVTPTSCLESEAGNEIKSHIFDEIYVSQEACHTINYNENKAIKTVILVSGSGQLYRVQLQNCFDDCEDGEREVIMKLDDDSADDDCDVVHGAKMVIPRVDYRYVRWSSNDSLRYGRYLTGVDIHTGAAVVADVIAMEGVTTNDAHRRHRRRDMQMDMHNPNSHVESNDQQYFTTPLTHSSKKAERSLVRNALSEFGHKWRNITFSTSSANARAMTTTAATGGDIVSCGVVTGMLMLPSFSLSVRPEDTTHYHYYSNNNNNNSSHLIQGLPISTMDSNSLTECTTRDEKTHLEEPTMEEMMITNNNNNNGTFSSSPVDNEADTRVPCMTPQVGDGICSTMVTCTSAGYLQTHRCMVDIDVLAFFSWGNSSDRCNSIDMGSYSQSIFFSPWNRAAETSPECDNHQRQLVVSSSKSVIQSERKELHCTGETHFLPLRIPCFEGEEDTKEAKDIIPSSMNYITDEDTLAWYEWNTNPLMPDKVRPNTGSSSIQVTPSGIYWYSSNKNQFTANNNEKFSNNSTVGDNNMKRTKLAGSPCSDERYIGAIRLAQILSHPVTANTSSPPSSDAQESTEREAIAANHSILIILAVVYTTLRGTSDNNSGNKNIDDNSCYGEEGLYVMYVDTRGDCCGSMISGMGQVIGPKQAETCDRKAQSSQTLRWQLVRYSDAKDPICAISLVRFASSCPVLSNRSAHYFPNTLTGDYYSGHHGMIGDGYYAAVARWSDAKCRVELIPLRKCDPKHENLEGDHNSTVQPNSTPTTTTSTTTSTTGDNICRDRRNNQNLFLSLLPICTALDHSGSPATDSTLMTSSTMTSIIIRLTACGKDNGGHNHLLVEGSDGSLLLVRVSHERCYSTDVSDTYPVHRLPLKGSTSLDTDGKYPTGTAMCGGSSFHECGNTVMPGNGWLQLTSDGLLMGATAVCPEAPHNTTIVFGLIDGTLILVNISTRCEMEIGRIHNNCKIKGSGCEDHGDGCRPLHLSVSSLRCYSLASVLRNNSDPARHYSTRQVKGITFLDSGVSIEKTKRVRLALLVYNSESSTNMINNNHNTIHQQSLIIVELRATYKYHTISRVSALPPPLLYTNSSTPGMSPMGSRQVAVLGIIGNIGADTIDSYRGLVNDKINPKMASNTAIRPTLVTMVEETTTVECTRHYSGGVSYSSSLSDISYRDPQGVGGVSSPSSCNKGLTTGTTKQKTTTVYYLVEYCAKTFSIISKKRLSHPAVGAGSRLESTEPIPIYVPNGKLVAGCRSTTLCNYRLQGFISGCDISNGAGFIMPFMCGPLTLDCAECGTPLVTTTRTPVNDLTTIGIEGRVTLVAATHTEIILYNATDFLFSSPLCEGVSSASVAPIYVLKVLSPCLSITRTANILIASSSGLVTYYKYDIKSKGLIERAVEIMPSSIQTAVSGADGCIVKSDAKRNLTISLLHDSAYKNINSKKAKENKGNDKEDGSTNTIGVANSTSSASPRKSSKPNSKTYSVPLKCVSRLGSWALRITCIGKGAMDENNSYDDILMTPSAYNVLPSLNEGVQSKAIVSTHNDRTYPHRRHAPFLFQKLLCPLFEARHRLLNFNTAYDPFFAMTPLSQRFYIHTQDGGLQVFVALPHEAARVMMRMERCIENYYENLKLLPSLVTYKDVLEAARDRDREGGQLSHEGTHMPGTSKIYNRDTGDDDNTSEAAPAPRRTVPTPSPRTKSSQTYTLQTVLPPHYYVYTERIARSLRSPSRTLPEDNVIHLNTIQRVLALPKSVRDVMLRRYIQPECSDLVTDSSVVALLHSSITMV